MYYRKRNRKKHTDSGKGNKCAITYEMKDAYTKILLYEKGILQVVRNVVSYIKKKSDFCNKTSISLDYQIITRSFKILFLMTSD